MDPALIPVYLLVSLPVIWLSHKLYRTYIKPPIPPSISGFGSAGGKRGGSKRGKRRWRHASEAEGQPGGGSGLAARRCDQIWKRNEETEKVAVQPILMST